MLRLIDNIIIVLGETGYENAEKVMLAENGIQS
jgi:hypothetical protein